MWKHRSNRGYSLTEVVVVTAILGIVAVVAIPGFLPAESQKLELAASEVVAALRFARTEALRTGDVHGVEVNKDSEQVTVSKADLTAVPVGSEFTLYHPVSKQPWDFNLATSTATAGVEVTNATPAFDYPGFGRRRVVLFDATGAPIFINTATGTIYHLGDGVVVLGLGNGVLTVRVAPYNGRVTVE